MQKLFNRQIFIQSDKGLTVAKGIVPIRLPILCTDEDFLTVRGFAKCNFALDEEFDPKFGESLATVRALQNANTQQLVAIRRAEAQLKRLFDENQLTKARLKAKEDRIIDSLDKTPTKFEGVTVSSTDAFRRFAELMNARK